MDRLVKENEQSEVNRNNMGMKVSGEKGQEILNPFSTD